MKVGDPKIQENASLSANGEEVISNIPDVLEGTSAPVKYATLEPYIWVLDGTYEIIGTESDDAEYEGFIPKEEIRTLKTRDGRKYYVVV